MKRLAILFVCLACLLSVSPAAAHPADLYYQTISARLSLGGARFTWNILPGIILAQVAWAEADLDRDSAVSTEEAERWAESILGDFRLALDGRLVQVRLDSAEWPSTLTELQNANVPIRLELSADWPVGLVVEHELAIQNQYNPQSSVTWFYLAGEDGVQFNLPDQRGNALQVRFGLLDQSSGETLTEWESGRPAIPGLFEAVGLGETAQQAAEQAPEKQGMSAILEGLLRSRESSPWFILAALAIAAIVGALHALTPGHGKTVVAAYLIGSRGTLLHAVFLGGIVTLTHTGSVFLLGLVTLLASQYILPTSLFPALEIVSGLLIVGLGATLLVQRVRAWMKSRVVPKLKILNTEDTKVHQGNVLGVTGQHTHAHGEGHQHDRAHDHGEHGHEHHIPDPSEISWRTLLALGVSGGLVPCPEAIAILLLAISISRILLGLSLILAFSFGLAFILIAIGVVMVQSKRLFARLGVLDRWAHGIPVVSATLVLLLGLALTFGAVRNAQASLGQQESPPAAAPAFDFDRARVLFLAPGPDKRNQLFVAPAAGGEPRQITDEPQGVRDYSVSPDGAWLAYSATEAGGGTNFWRLDAETFERSRLLACPSALCSKLTWSREGERALYSRLELGSGAPGLGVPSIWWLDLAGGDTGPVFQDAQIPALNFDWSPDGSWLSYTSGLTLEIRINNLTTGAGYAIPTRTGAHLAWSPAGDTFLLADILDVGDDSYRKVFRYTAGEEQGALLIDDLQYDEYEPAWSPDADRVALVRYRSGDAVLPSGDQIWLVRPDGEDLRPLTEDADTLHGKPVWSPDGQYLLFTYSGIGDPQPRIRALEIDSGAAYGFSPGSQPTWLP